MNALPRLGLAPRAADRLTMELLEEQLLDAINIPLRARRGQFRIDYTGHSPLLLVRAAGCEPELLCTMDTRSQYMVTRVPTSPDLARMMADTKWRLDGLNASIALAHDKDRQMRRRVRLQLTSRDSRHIALTLHGTYKGWKSDWIGPFGPGVKP